MKWNTQRAYRYAANTALACSFLMLVNLVFDLLVKLWTVLPRSTCIYIGGFISLLVCTFVIGGLRGGKEQR